MIRPPDRDGNLDHKRETGEKRACTRSAFAYNAPIARGVPFLPGGRD